MNNELGAFSMTKSNEPTVGEDEVIESLNV